MQTDSAEPSRLRQMFAEQPDAVVSLIGDDKTSFAQWDGLHLDRAGVADVTPVPTGTADLKSTLAFMLKAGCVARRTRSEAHGPTRSQCLQK